MEVISSLMVGLPMQFNSKTINNLKKISNDLRISIVKAIFKVKKGHIGGSFSCLDILVSIYHSNLFKLRKKNFIKKNNDIFILSKGHSAIALYSVLNSIKLSNSFDLKNFHKQGGALMEHPSPNSKLPGIEIETGSLGNGIGIGAGMAYVEKKKFIIVLVGDGELYEGSNWEAMMMASHYNLKNILVIVDRNYSITLDKTENVIKLENLKDKIKAFGFETTVVDGHNYKKIIQNLKKFKLKKGIKPSCMICNTVKGIGSGVLEGDLKFHHAVPNEAEYKKILLDLKKNYAY